MLPGANWSDTTFTSTTLSGLANGYFRATIVTNAIPSLSSIILIATPSVSAPPAPSGLTAGAITASSVVVSWHLVAAADSYQVLRNAGGGFSLISTVTSLSYTDSVVSPNTAHLYKVRAVTSGLASHDSNIDLATTVIFTDDPLVAQTTTVKGVHLTEMRTAVNAVRALAGLSAATWTDPSLGGVRIKAVHITELRAALDAGRSSLTLSMLSYTNTLNAGTSRVRAVDFTEIRNGTK